ncbi:hypothetical protein GCM10010185_05430 [Saccharothrix coeruleofusca]|uniref:Uncharacterized protein n=1 Tax=Saccharothrix coeruleofusca TaxID=33919 RepID=A0A918AGM9_9PSEU|nr:hypothetical protein GCM10010185_05430 [Saccharothrix coeruleofusca]
MVYWLIALVVAISFMTLGGMVCYLHRSPGRHGNPDGAACTVGIARQQVVVATPGQWKSAQHESTARRSNFRVPQRVEAFVVDDTSLLVRPYVLHAQARREFLFARAA